MEEAGRGCGLLKVVVTHGRNLAVRDFTSSDPYVIVHVADKNDHHLWQEVFDWDRFKYDDKMGQAFLDLQPVAAATKLRRALRLTAGETNLRKVNPDADNCLLSDSFVTYANGEVAIDARLRLREVESGELFVTIKWIEPDSANTGKQADH
ncbi:protein C2-DOMAIN ABA-RELATED 11 isoform X5 [Zea mays]|uniref:protein C2-DOMAIN ABA-RELATED 11 isoform X5 n=1 Tax=Zea mays TaxID=4577 RepID=UPI0004DEB233|nr:uncharacterized protein LOC100272270 isoform X5 [Zea mays]XP_035816298.1 uncharacterized protein LOC100272270 isoform X5 [Zea mays]|eukprot:XP_008651031.1 protein C2-DOMAIN ABA-RELATED 11 isoform X5 [Zea mays]